MTMVIRVARRIIEDVLNFRNHIISRAESNVKRSSYAIRAVNQIELMSRLSGQSGAYALLPTPHQVAAYADRLSVRVL